VTLSHAVSAFDAVSGLPIASIWLFTLPTLLVINSFLLPAGALALSRAGAFGIAFAFRIAPLLRLRPLDAAPLAFRRARAFGIAFAFHVAALLRLPLAGGAVLCALGRPFALRVRLWLSSAASFHPARSTFSARSALRLCGARRVHLALRACTCGTRRAHSAAGLATAGVSTACSLTATLTLRQKRGGTDGEHGAHNRRYKNSSHDCISSFG
jgi:hypothetical protein